MNSVCLSVVSIACMSSVPKEIAAIYGEDSNIYRVRVLGEFPQSEDDAVNPASPDRSGP